MSEKIDGPFLNIIDESGRGEDHCQFIGGTQNGSTGDINWDLPDKGK